MKSKEIHAWLEAHINVLELGCSDGCATELRQLLSLFEIRETILIKDICGAIERASPSVAQNEGVTVANINTIFDLMIKCTAPIASKTAKLNLKLLRETLHKHENLNLESLLNAISNVLNKTGRIAQTQEADLGDTAVRDYVRRLEEALGDEQGFDEEYARLVGDKRIKAPDAKQIAKAFAGKSGRSKSDALGLIAARQQSLIGARAKADATGGRSAA